MEFLQHLLATILIRKWKHSDGTVCAQTDSELVDFIHQHDVILHVVNPSLAKPGSLVTWASCFCLGRHVFLRTNESGCVSRSTILHEIGHRVQSKRYGLLYLMIIGVPSFFRNMLYRSRYRPLKVGYYDRWPEKQASLIGERLIPQLKKNSYYFCGFSK